jgi:hypothetical protein
MHLAENIENKRTLTHSRIRALLVEALCCFGGRIIRWGNFLLRRGITWVVGSSIANVDKMKHEFT